MKDIDRKNPPRQKARMARLIGAATVLALMVLASACSYRYYLGMHGPSIKKHPTIHAKVVSDKTCLMCHAPGTTMTAPKTTHPKFTGCLKCHNDDVKDSDR